MAYLLEKFFADVKDAIKSDTGPGGREVVRQRLENLLSDPEFISSHCGANARPGVQTIYRDLETGFNVLVHVYSKSRTSPPHDHGPSWAVYGVASGWTDMTIWNRKDDGTKEGHADILSVEVYRVAPGMAAKFDPGVIHSIHFPDGAQFIRVTGTPSHRASLRLYCTGQAAGG
jgi:hypothetical protein